MFYVLNYQFAINIWQWCPGGCCVEFDFWRNRRFWLVLELTSPPQIIYSSTITFELFFFQKFRRFKTWSISDSGITVDKCLLKLNSKLRYRIFYSEYRSHKIKPNQTYHCHRIINRIFTKITIFRRTYYRLLFTSVRSRINSKESRSFDQRTDCRVFHYWKTII